jgi:hypothetical protein
MGPAAAPIRHGFRRSQFVTKGPRPDEERRCVVNGATAICRVIWRAFFTTQGPAMDSITSDAVMGRFLDRVRDDLVSNNTLQGSWAEEIVAAFLGVTALPGQWNYFDMRDTNGRTISVEQSVGPRAKFDVRADPTHGTTNLQSAFASMIQRRRGGYRTRTGNRVDGATSTSSRPGRP